MCLKFSWSVSIHVLEIHLICFNHLIKKRLETLSAERRNGIVIDWPTRMRIACGAARGLAYLHEDCKEPKKRPIFYEFQCFFSVSNVCLLDVNLGFKFLTLWLNINGSGHPRVIHRDIKSSNILLNDNFEAQVNASNAYR